MRDAKRLPYGLSVPPKGGAAPLDASGPLAVEPRLARFVELARERFGALEVWLFGSRARGDHREDSDWDLMVVLGDEAPPSALHPVPLWQLGRDAGLIADVVADRASDLRGFGAIPTTLQHQVVREGVRLA